MAKKTAIAAPEEEEKKKKRRLGPRKFGKGLGTATRYAGKGLRATGRGLYEFGAGVKEGIGPISVPSARDVGRVAGQSTRLLGIATKEAWKALPSYVSKQPTQALTSPSHLPMEVQQAMVTILGETQPEIFRSLWEPGIRVSSFIGKLRQYYPELHEEIKSAIYQSIGMKDTGIMRI